MKLLTLGSACISSRVADFEYNTNLIKAAILEAKKQNVDILVTPELCICGYGVEDKIRWRYMMDETERRIHEISKFIIENRMTHVLIYIGCPILVGDLLYNALLCITDYMPYYAILKSHLPNYDRFYEPRNWTAWPENSTSLNTTMIAGYNIVTGKILIHYKKEYVGASLLQSILDGHGRVATYTRLPNHNNQPSETNPYAPRYDADIEEVEHEQAGYNNKRNCNIIIGGEICEDLWAPKQGSTNLCLHGAHLIVNGSASPFSPSKNLRRRNMIQEFCERNLCVYVYANAIGIDGANQVFDGGGFIASPHGIVSNPTFQNSDMSLLTATVDFDEILDMRRNNTTFRDSMQIEDDSPRSRYYCINSPAIDPYNPVEEWLETRKRMESEYRLENVIENNLYETMTALSFALKEYYIRAGCFKHIILSLSGGRDSTLCLVIAKMACDMMHVKPSEIIRTFYLAHRINSSDATANAASELAESMGIPFKHNDITDLCDAMENCLFEDPTGITKQNIQARMRGSFTLNMANTLDGLVLVTSNMSEAAVGYCTTGGDNQGGISLIGNIPKTMVNKLLKWVSDDDTCPFISMKAKEKVRNILELEPSAELQPNQKDEVDLMPYEILDSLLEHYIKDKRSIEECYLILIIKYSQQYQKLEILDWCEKFIKLLSRNQWKREQHPSTIRVLDFDLDPKCGFRFPVLQNIDLELNTLNSIRETI